MLRLHFNFHLLLLLYCVSNLLISLSILPLGAVIRQLVVDSVCHQIHLLHRVLTFYLS